MKRVEALVQPSKLHAVREALEMRGVEGFTISEVDGFDCGSARNEFYRGATYAVDRQAMVKLEVAVPDHQAIPVAYTIVDSAGIDGPRDGKVSIMPVDEIIRIRTDQRGASAI